MTKIELPHDILSLKKSTEKRQKMLKAVREKTNNVQR
jgi:hypothetical protein